jgi:hypothetical protein
MVCSPCASSDGITATKTGPVERHRVRPPIACSADEGQRGSPPQDRIVRNQTRFQQDGACCSSSAHDRDRLLTHIAEDAS